MEYAKVKNKNKSYVVSLVKIFETYLNKELSVFEGGVGYDIVYDYIKELEERIQRFIKFHNPRVRRKKGVPREFIKSSARYSKKYLKGVADILREKSMLYSPADGSVPEDIGNLLRKLSDLFLKK